MMSWLKVSPTPTISMSLWELISSDKREERSLHIISQFSLLTSLSRVGHIRGPIYLVLTNIVTQQVD